MLNTLTTVCDITLTFGNITSSIGNVSAYGNLQSYNGNITAPLGTISGQSISATGNISATGIISVGFITTTGNISATGNVSAGSITTIGNITGNVGPFSWLICTASSGRPITPTTYGAYLGNDGTYYSALELVCDTL
ncbi:MAG: hypothetical protein ACKPKO_61690 [Candidatus Fonsibacter sp.]